MNWKTTAVAGVLFAAAALAYVLTLPPSGGRGPDDTRIFPSQNPDHVARIEVSRPERPEIIIEQRHDPVSNLRWRIVQPIDRLAEEGLVLDMLLAMLPMTKSAGIPPGDPRHEPQKLGLDNPSLVVSLVFDRKISLRFGNASTIEPTLRYFQIDGDPSIYLHDGAVCAPFERELSELRNKGLALFDNLRVHRLELETRYLRRVPEYDDKGVRKGWKDVTTYEVGTIAYNNGTAELAAGWYLTALREDGQERKVTERLDDARVNLLAANLRGLTCTRFLEKADPAAYGLDQPDVRYRLWLRGDEKPTVIAINTRREADPNNPGRQTTVLYGLCEGTGDIGILKQPDVEHLFRRRNELRPVTLFSVAPDRLRGVEIRNAVGRLKLVATQPPGDPPPPPVWVMVEPTGIRSLPSVELEGLAQSLLALQIKDWWPIQPDLKLLGLDPPMLTLKVTTLRPDRGEVVEEFGLGWKGGEEAYLLSPGATEIRVLDASWFQTLDRVDLLARSRELLSIPRSAITEIGVEFQQQNIFAPVYYILKKGAGDEWTFGNHDLKDAKVDPQKMSLLLSQLNYIEAESYISRRPEKAKEFGLDTPKPPARVTIRWEVEGRVNEIALHISRPVTAAGGSQNFYYARFQPVRFGVEDPMFQIVFRAKEQLVNLIRAGVQKEKRPDEGTNPTPPPDPHGHDDGHRDR